MRARGGAARQVGGAAKGDGGTPRGCFVGRLAAHGLYDAEYGEARGQTRCSCSAAAGAAWAWGSQFDCPPVVFYQRAPAVQALPRLKAVAEGGVLPGVRCDDLG